MNPPLSILGTRNGLEFPESAIGFVYIPPLMFRKGGICVPCLENPFLQIFCYIFTCLHFQYVNVDLICFVTYIFWRPWNSIHFFHFFSLVENWKLKNRSYVFVQNGGNELPVHRSHLLHQWMLNGVY